MGVERLQQELGLAVRWVPFPLHPETPPEGRSLDDLFAGTGVDLDGMLERMHATAHGLGLPVGDRRHTYNSRLAQELAEWAEHRGQGEAFRSGVYRAYFADGANLAESEVLTGIAQAAGLPADEARQILAGRTYSAAVDAHWQRATTLGVRAVPAHRFRGAIAVGYHPYPELRRFLISNGAGAAIQPTARPEPSF